MAHMFALVNGDIFVARLSRGAPKSWLLASIQDALHEGWLLFLLAVSVIGCCALFSFSLFAAGWAE